RQISSSDSAADDVEIAQLEQENRQREADLTKKRNLREITSKDLDVTCKSETQMDGYRATAQGNVDGATAGQKAYDAALKAWNAAVAEVEKKKAAVASIKSSEASEEAVEKSVQDEYQSAIKAGCQTGATHYALGTEAAMTHCGTFRVPVLGMPRVPTGESETACGIAQNAKAQVNGSAKSLYESAKSDLSAAYRSTISVHHLSNVQLTNCQQQLESQFRYDAISQQAGALPSTMPSGCTNFPASTLWKYLTAKKSYEIYKELADASVWESECAPEIARIKAAKAAVDAATTNVATQNTSTSISVADQKIYDSCQGLDRSNPDSKGTLKCVAAVPALAAARDTLAKTKATRDSTAATAANDPKKGALTEDTSGIGFSCSELQARLADQNSAIAALESEISSTDSRIASLRSPASAGGSETAVAQSDDSSSSPLDPDAVAGAAASGGKTKKGLFGKLFKKKKDTDGDGKVSAEERTAAKAAKGEKKGLFKNLLKKKKDTDGDGVVSDEERAAAKAANGEKKGLFKNLFKKKNPDLNGDGTVDAEESATNASKKEKKKGFFKNLFKNKKDMDGDGDVDATDTALKREKRKANGG
ncbi:MAG: hypothetical protein AAB425_12200, partial [Bdellovibrionota bacterium]